VKRLKLALVVGAFPKLSETFVLQQIEQLLTAGHDVHIFAFEAPTESLRHPVIDRLELLSRTTYLRGPDHLSHRLRSFRQRLSSARPARFDAILCHFGHIGERARKLRERGVFAGPLAVIFHAYDLTVWVRQNGAQAYAALFREADLLLPISLHWRTRLLELGAPPLRTRVLHMGRGSSSC
jgi:colanic acid/amylovoran biosynthesis glycosyltransferase